MAVFDRLEAGLPLSFNIPSVVGKKREIENYLCRRDVLLRFAEGMEPDDLVGRALRATRREAMEEAIEMVADAIRVLGRDPWSNDEKVSDEFLPRVFKIYFDKLKNDDRLNKSGFHILAEFLHVEEIDKELVDCLNLIAFESARAATKSAS